MRCRVDAPREPTDDGETRIRELVRKLLCALRAVVARAAGTDHSNGVLIARRQFAPDVEDDWRRVNFKQLARVIRRLRRHYFHPEFPDACQFGGKIYRVFPICDLVRHVIADTLDGPSTHGRAPD